MKAIEKPTQTALASALGIDPAMVTRDKRRGMPIDSIEAAQAWRDQNVRVRWTPEADTEAVGVALNGERLAERAAALLQAAGELLDSGGDIAPMVATIRQAMAAVPFDQRSRLRFPFNIMDALTEEVNRVMDKGDPAGLIYGTLYPTKRAKGEAIDMGAFWYAVAAGEIRVRRPKG
jgi:hypothetical protein